MRLSKDSSHKTYTQYFGRPITSSSLKPSLLRLGGLELEGNHVEATWTLSGKETQY
jgi:hypothetical protein